MAADKEQLVKVIDFWQKTVEKEYLYPRHIVEQIDVKSKEIVDLAGPRRSGKSSVMKLLIRKLQKEAGCLYMNFEDPFFVDYHDAGVIEQLIETYREYFDAKGKYLFFDEIQNISQWEKVVRKLREEGRYKIFVTGSSAKLLSGELATLLSGRHLSYQLLPLSFLEYLSFQGIPIPDRKTLITDATGIEKQFRAYLDWGGFPQIALVKDAALLKQYFYDIVERDIIQRYDIRGKEALKRMGVYCATQAGKLISLASLKRTFDISHLLASRYLEYFQDAFLFFSVPQFSFSLKTQQKAQKKMYAVDTGLASAVSFRFSEDRGRILENAVFIELLRRGRQVYYWKGTKGEVDFVVPRADRTHELIQVCWSIHEEGAQARELKGIAEARSVLNVSMATVVTFSERGRAAAGGTVLVRPAYEWMSQGEERIRGKMKKRD